MCSIAYGHRPSRAPLGIFLAAFLILLASGMLMLYGYSQYQGRQPVLKPYPMPRPDYIDTSQSHGIRNHGDEAMRAYRCYRNNSMADSVFRHKHDRHGWVWIILCKDMDGRWYARVVRMVKGVVTEITAFMVQDGTKDWEDVAGWLQRKVFEFDGHMVTKASQLPWK
jgi:hypothetical protein